MRLFAYGTLCDLDVLATVLGHPVHPSAVQPAHVDGYAALRVAGRSYPVLVAMAGARGDGRLIDGLDAHDWRRLDLYEGDEYHRLALSVTDAAGASTEAQVYLPRATTRHDGTRWDLASWQRTEKARFVRGPVGTP